MNSIVAGDVSESVFDLLLTRPVVNCCGIYTDLGGSVLSPGVWRAVEELNGSYVRMTELLDNCSTIVAECAGAEAARITPGASAALALAVGATMTGDEGKRWEQLPDTTGLKNQAVISAYHLANYKYAVCARMNGAKLVGAGPVDAFDLDALIAAVGERTACILVPAHLLDGFNGTDQLAEVVRRAHSVGVPVVVDAAYMSYPVSLISAYAAAGVDLTCFSAKYFFGPNSGGFVSGRKDLIGAVVGLDFTRFESGEFKSFGRPFKMSRYDVAATALALREWTQMDHASRWAGYSAKVATMAAAVPELPGISFAPKLFTLDERLVDAPEVNSLAIDFGGDAPIRPAAVAAELESGTPIIAAVVYDDKLVLAVDAMLDGQEELVADRLAEAFSITASLSAAAE